MPNEGSARTISSVVKQQSARIARYLDEKTRDIDHRHVISDLAVRTELSGTYLSSLVLANLIALLGLLVDSVAVVIGAMLISPLMGPIFSLGLAFTMGDFSLSRRAVRNILFSVLLTICIAALFTLLSPLKGATHEILSRTRPNVYDLLIAVFSGTAGSLALCTRKNYLFTTTGVAVATAVIPPLSVVGYGVGTWQIQVAAGGFLLFFTNLVAIVISSNIVFYTLRFRGTMAAEHRYPARRRFQILGVVLVVISIPLIYTLVTDIRKVKLTGRVESTLKAHFNHQGHSRLTGVSVVEEKDSVKVMADINTVTFVGGDILRTIERQLAAEVGRPVSLGLEQIIVQSGNIEPTPAPHRRVFPVAPPPETLSSLREKSMGRLRDGCREVESYIAPFKVNGCTLTFSDRGAPVTVNVAIARDYPPDAQEVRWLTTVLQKKLAEPVAVTVLTEPFLPPVSFTDVDQIAEESRRMLGSLKHVIAQMPEYRLTIVSPRSGKSRPEKQVRQRLVRLRDFLATEVVDAGVNIRVMSGRDDQFHVTVTN